MLEGIAVERFRYAPVAKWQTLAAPGAIMPNLHRHPILYALVPVLLLAQLVALVSLLRRERFDVVHCHWLVPQGLVLALAGLFVRIPPTLMTCHGADAFTLEFPPFGEIKRRLLRSADAVTVVSREIAEHLGAVGTQAPLHIPMGVDLAGFVERGDVPAGMPTLLFVGRLAPKKGLDRLIRVMADSRIAGRNASLRIIGDGPLRQGLEKLSASLGLAARVTFLGAMPHANVAREMRGADVFCAPFVIGDDGDREGMPTVLLEAAASGIPIITSDIGGCGDIVESGHSGWLLPPGDEAALADAIVEALDNATHAQEMATQARAPRRTLFLAAHRRTLCGHIEANSAFRKAGGVMAMVDPIYATCLDGQWLPPSPAKSCPLAPVAYKPGLSRCVVCPA